jgi:dihydrolipoamide dehydrogenase
MTTKTNSAREAELVVIGGGPGGYAAAFLAADLGMKVTMIDAAERPGGVCLHMGCIPSKALLHVARVITEAREAEACGIKFGKPKTDLEALRRWGKKVVDTLASGIVELCKRRKVELIQARAQFENSQTIRLDPPQPGEIHFQHAILATGSHPATLRGVNLQTPRLMDSTAALRLEEIPETLLVIGGGYIGLELGTVYATLGSRVTVVEMTDGLLPGVDRDLVKVLQRRLEKIFHAIHLNTKVEALADSPSGLRATFDGEVSEQKQTFARVLVAVGRRPNTSNLGLDRTKVELDEKGFVRVDDRRRTTDDRIYAIGDIAGEPMLAHKATREAKVAVEALTGLPAAFDCRAIPAVVFTDPEIAWCGLTETDAQRQGQAIKVAGFPWTASGRAVTLGRTDGLTRLIIDAATDRVLGVGIVGTGAGELIAEGVLAVEMGAVARDLALTIHPHPTLTETICEAAEVHLGHATHLFRAKR